MRKLITILLFWILSISINAGTYYVAPSTATPSGNDGAAGTIAAPWLTWGKAFSTAVAGDTVYFRGGIYPHTVTNGNGYRTFNNGTSDDWICFFAYPADLAAYNYPILDCSNVSADEVLWMPTAIRETKLRYVIFRGLTIRNLHQHDSDDEPAIAWYIGGQNARIENCRTYNIHGIAYCVTAGDASDDISRDFYIVNSDAWDCCDSLSSGNTGTEGTGFFTAQQDNTSTVYMQSCRAWRCSDQGFSDLSRGYVEHSDNWSWDHGQLGGRGWGFKMGYTYESAIGVIQRKYTNCIAAFNKAGGFVDNASGGIAIYQILYNCVAYYTGYKGGSLSDHPKYGYHFANTVSSDALELQTILRNNLGYHNEMGDIRIQSGRIIDATYNSWNIPPDVTVTAEDFLSLDSAGIAGVRQGDGSLPVLNFLRPKTTTSFINRGVDVGLPYNGTAPDLGPYELIEEIPPPIVNPYVSTSAVTNITLTGATAGGNVSYDGGASVTDRGICWAKTVLPTIAGNHTHSGTGTGSFSVDITNLDINTVYHVRAFATNSAGTSYGADVQFSTYPFRYAMYYGYWAKIGDLWAVYGAVTTYYVSNSGDDLNDGLSSTRPWNTITKVNSFTFAPGNKILFKRGDTFTDARLEVSTSGTVANPITYSAYGTGDNPLIDAEDTRENGIYCNGKSYITIENIEVKNAVGHGVLVYDYYNTGATNVILDGITSNDNASCGFSLSIPYITIRNCTANDNGVAEWHGIYMGSFSQYEVTYADNYLIENCHTSGNAHAGIQCWHAGSGTIRYNDSHGNGPLGNLAWGIVVDALAANSNIEVYYNKLYDNAYYGISCINLKAGSSAKIYNNTVYANATSDPGEGAGIYIAGNDLVSAGMIEVKNNLVWNSTAVDFKQTGTTTPYDVSNNDYYRASGNMIIWGGTTYTSTQFATYQSASGDALSYSVDPLVTNAVTGDFTLTSSSTLIDKGIDVGLEIDYSGDAIVGNPDMGAYEFPLIVRYVDEGGDDGNTGLIDDPYLTVAYAATQPGSLIHVNAGTYVETSPIVLGTGVSLIGEGSTSIISTSIAGEPLVQMESAVEGTVGNQSISYLKFTGNNVALRAIQVTRRNNVEIHHCAFEDFFSNAVTYNGAALNTLPTIFATGNKFYSDTVTNCSAYISGDEGKGALSFSGQSGMLVYNNNISQEGRAQGYNGYLIKCVGGHNKGIKIYNNTLYRPYDGGSYDFAIEYWHGLGGLEIYNNTITGGVDLVGTEKNAYSYGAWIHDNTIGQAVLTDYVTYGVLLEYSTDDIIIEKNHIQNVANGVYFQQGISGTYPTSTVQDVRISYNIFENMGNADTGSDSRGWGVHFADAGSASSTYDSIYVFNNVFTAQTGTKTTMGGVELPRIGATSGFYIRNNIIQGFDLACVYGNGSEGQTVDVLSVENNINYLNGQSNLPYYLDLTPTNNTTQNNQAGANPTFVSATNFHLDVGSPAIETGLDLDIAGLTDYDDVTVSETTPCIGAYEY